MNFKKYTTTRLTNTVCIEHDPKRWLQRWNFPFKSLEIAKLYLRTADYTTKRECGIYEIRNSKGRTSYKIFINVEDLKVFLNKNKDKSCESMTPVFCMSEYKEYQNTKVQKLTFQEIEKYMTER